MAPSGTRIVEDSQKAYNLRPRNPPTSINYSGKTRPPDAYVDPKGGHRSSRNGARRRPLAPQLMSAHLAERFSVDDPVNNADIDTESLLSLGSTVRPLTCFPYRTCGTRERTLAGDGQFPFLELPVEKRLEVYDIMYLRRDEHEIRDLAGTQPAMMVTSREMREESTRAYYGNGPIYYGVIDRHQEALTGRVWRTGNFDRCFMVRFRQYVEKRAYALRFVEELRFRLDPCHVCAPASQVCTSCAGSEAGFDRECIEHLPGFPSCNFAPLLKFGFSRPDIQIYMESSHWLLPPTATRIQARLTCPECRITKHYVDWKRFIAFMAQPAWKDALETGQITDMRSSGHRTYRDYELTPHEPRARLDRDKVNYIDVNHITVSKSLTEQYPTLYRMHRFMDDFILPLRFTLLVPPTSASRGYTMFVEARNGQQWKDWEGVRDLDSLTSVQKLLRRRYVVTSDAEFTYAMAEAMENVKYTTRDMWTVGAYLRAGDIGLEDDPDA